MTFSTLIRPNTNPVEINPRQVGPLRQTPLLSLLWEVSMGGGDGEPGRACWWGRAALRQLPSPVLSRGAFARQGQGPQGGTGRGAVGILGDVRDPGEFPAGPDPAGQPDAA